MLSIPYSVFEDLFEDMRIQMALVLHITEDHCRQWSQCIIDESIETSALPEDYDEANLHRFLRNPGAACSQFYLSSVHSFMFRSTALLELYLKDSLKQLMKLNLDLFARGFRKKDEVSGMKCKILRWICRRLCKKEGTWEVKGLPSRLAKYYSDNEYIKYLNAIARHYTRGEKWSEKYKHYCRFLEIEQPEGASAANKKLDSLYALRNDIGHLNRHFNEPPTITTEKGFVFHRETELDCESYRDVVLHLIGLMQEAITLLEKSDESANRKWPRNRALKDPIARAAEYESVITPLT